MFAIISAFSNSYTDFAGIRLTEAALFRGISAAARRTLSSIRHSKLVQPGELIISQSDIPADITILLEGDAFLVEGNSATESIGVRLAVEHEIFGVTELLGHSPFRYNLKALTGCRIDTISKDDFEKFLTDEKLPRSRLIRILGIAVEFRYRLARSV